MKVTRVIYFVSIVVLSSCYTTVKPPVDYSSFRRTQSITINPPKELKRSKEFFVLFPEYVNQEPTDSAALVYFNSRLNAQLRSLGYVKIVMLDGTSYSTQNKKDTTNTFVTFTSISLFESKHKETLTEPTSKAEDYVNLKSITSQIYGEAKTNIQVKEKYRAQNIFGQGTEKETYTGKWEYSRSLLDVAVGAEKSWRYRASVSNMPSDVIYKVLDQMARNTAKDIDLYVRFVN